MEQQQALLKNLAINALGALYEGDMAKKFIQMAQNTNPASALAGTARMLIDSQVEAAKQGGVDLNDDDILNAGANEISKHLGKLLVIGGVVPEKELPAVMKQGAQEFMAALEVGEQQQMPAQAQPQMPQQGARQAPGGLIAQAQGV